MKKNLTQLFKKTGLFLTVMLSLSSLALADAIPPLHPDGKVYNKLAGDWWRWAASIPYSEHPLVGNSATNVSEGQSGYIWFLGGSFTDTVVNRKVTIPRGKALFFPLINVITDNIGVEPPKTPAELVAQADEVIDSVNVLTATLDGVKLADNLFEFRAESGPITITSPEEDSLLGSLYGMPISGDLYPSVTNGYWVFLTPLSVGKHTLKFTGGIDTPDFKYINDVTYEITVKK